ncbi:hypothetical protein Patl1_15617 [Pistacia atlantica]|uniref:Uncharacterized protein n=1 Tax=Pistacia atlantica TaxID=434234 RepID=A0ACC1B563_9ROSI|nr:hypothetical protein Patl1_15617 [Pistacia atlantica]
MNTSHLGISLLLLLCLLSSTLQVHSQSSPDALSMKALKASLGNPENLGWFDPDPCKWKYITCWNNRVTKIQISSHNLTGSLPVDLKNLSSLIVLEVTYNQLKGPIPSLTSLRSIRLDYNPYISSWEIPESIKDATALQIFTADVANIWATIPDFFGRDTFPALKVLRLAMNNLEGSIPSSFAKSSIETLVLSDQNSISKLNGSVAVLQNMTSLTLVSLYANNFTGPLPDFSRLNSLEHLDLKGNQLTGIVPFSLVNLPKLSTVYLNNNFLQGPTPEFDKSKVDSDIGDGFNSFCLDDPGVACYSRVNVLLSIVESMDYPVVFAQSWVGNDLAVTLNSGRESHVTLDVSNNHLYGKVPNFRPSVSVETAGNPDVQNYTKVSPAEAPHLSLPRIPPSTDDLDRNSNASYNLGYVIVAVYGLIIIIGLGVFMYVRKGKHSRYWRLLRFATNNFSDRKILGRGGFGTIYEGDLPDGSKIAVKRMKAGALNEQGLKEFKSEIEVLTKVRHCHLVALLGYCREGNEGLLVYEYMSQGSLSRHLFNWKEEGLKPLEWSQRLRIALYVARGLEYLHGLANQTFIHGDLKPSNILLGDDMHAKIADFGLARLVPHKGRHSIETRLVGTLGYIAPECIVTGCVTTKVDVFGFRVILMELITGKKAIDATLPEDMVHLIPWFRRMHTNKDTFRTAIDETFGVDEETLASVSKVAELADHCCTGEPSQRPDMNHVVNVLSSLVEVWRPVELVYDDIYGINLNRDEP